MEQTFTVKLTQEQAALVNRGLTVLERLDLGPQERKEVHNLAKRLRYEAREARKGRGCY